MASGNGFTPGKNGFTQTEYRMLEVLKDGKPHAVDELHKCLWDDQSQRSAVRFHVSNLRTKLNKEGLEISVRHVTGRVHYLLSRLLYDPYDGRV